MDSKKLKEYCSTKTKEQLQKYYEDKVEQQFAKRLEKLKEKHKRELNKLEEEKRRTLYCESSYLDYAKNFNKTRNLVKHFVEKVKTLPGFKLQGTSDWNVSYGYFISKNNLNQSVGVTFHIKQSYMWFSVHGHCYPLHGLCFTIKTNKDIDNALDQVRQAVEFWDKIENFCIENKITNISTGERQAKNDFEYGMDIVLKFPKSTKKVIFNAYTNKCEVVNHSSKKLNTSNLFNSIQSSLES